MTDWYGPETATFGDRVAAAREQAGMTQKEMAKRLGVKTSTVRAWEDDAAEPRANRLSMMAGVLNVSIMWLINGEGDGIDAPSEDTGTIPDLQMVLTELRALRSDLKAKSDQVARLEKRLRQVVQVADAGAGADPVVGDV